jgi:hypothetical protein
VKGIQACYIRPDSLKRGDNHKNVKIGWDLIDIFSSRTTGPILTKLGTNHHWEEGFEFVQMKRIYCPSPRGGNSKRVKIH